MEDKVLHQYKTTGYIIKLCTLDFTAFAEDVIKELRTERYLVVLNCNLLLISLSTTLQIFTVIPEYLNFPVFLKASTSVSTFCYYSYSVENSRCGILGYDAV